MKVSNNTQLTAEKRKYTPQEWIELIEQAHTHIKVTSVSKGIARIECQVCGHKASKQCSDLVRLDSRISIGCSRCGGYHHIAFIKDFHTDSDSYLTRKMVAELQQNLKEKYHGKIRAVPGQTINSARDRIQFECLINECGHKWATRLGHVTSRKIKEDSKNIYGCTKCAARAKANEAGNIRKPRATASEKQVAKDMRSSGMTYNAIGKKLGRCSTTIRLWCDDSAREYQNSKHQEWRSKNPDNDRMNNQRYYSSDHGRKAYYRKNHKRRAIEFHCADHVFLPDHPDADHQGFVYYDMWSDYVKGDSEAMNLFSFAGADEAVAFRKKQQEKFEKFSGIKWSLDHLVPLSRGGIHHPLNFVNLPLVDNTSKNNKRIQKDDELFCKRLFDIK